MTELDRVKMRMNVLYDDPVTDGNLQSQIDSCRAWMEAGGVPMDVLLTSPLVIDAYVLWAKMAQSTEPRAMMRHPVITSIIKQLGGA